MALKLFKYEDKPRDSNGFILTGKDRLYFFLNNPGWLKYYFSWRKTLIIKKNNPDATALDYELPWFTYGAIEWIRNYLRPDMRVFEYGAGGSTLFIGRRVKELISIDHYEPWYLTVLKEVENRRLNGVNIRLIEPEKGCKPGFLSNTFPEYRDYNFEKYVKAIDEYPDHYFDLVIIDGRAREACIGEAISKIRAGGYLLLDNSDRPNYSSALKSLDIYAREDFFGYGPFLDYFWNTTVWQIR